MSAKDTIYNTLMRHTFLFPSLRFKKDMAPKLPRYSEAQKKENIAPNEPTKAEEKDPRLPTEILKLAYFQLYGDGGLKANPTQADILARMARFDFKLKSDPNNKKVSEKIEELNKAIAKAADALLGTIKAFKNQQKIAAEHVNKLLEKEPLFTDYISASYFKTPEKDTTVPDIRKVPRTKFNEKDPEIFGNYCFDVAECQLKGLGGLTQEPRFAIGFFALAVKNNPALLEKDIPPIIKYCKYKVGALEKGELKKSFQHCLKALQKHCAPMAMVEMVDKAVTEKKLSSKAAKHLVGKSFLHAFNKDSEAYKKNLMKITNMLNTKGASRKRRSAVLRHKTIRPPAPALVPAGFVVPVPTKLKRRKMH